MAFFLFWVEAEGLVNHQGRAGITSIVRWNLRPVIPLGTPGLHFIIMFFRELFHLGLHLKFPPFFNSKFPGLRKIHKSFLESGQRNRAMLPAREIQRGA